MSVEAPLGEYRFGTFVLDNGSMTLSRDGRDLALTPQPMRLLLYLLERPAEVVTRDELVAHLWPDRVVEYDQGLNFCIRQIRAVLGDRPRRPLYVETRAGVGYRFIAPVSFRPSAPGSSETTTDSAVPRAPERGRPGWGAPRRVTGGRVAIILACGLVVAGVATATGPTIAEGNGAPVWRAVNDVSARTVGSVSDVGGAATMPDEVRRMVEVADEYMRRSLDPEAALFAADLYSRAATIDPSSVEAQSGLAIASAVMARRHGAYEREAAARSALARVLALDPNGAASSLARSAVRFHLDRDVSGSIESLSRSDVPPALVPRFLVARAEAERTRGQWLTAVALLEQAYELDPRRFEVNFWLALTHQDLGEYTPAVRYWRTATAIAPSVPASYGHFALLPVLFGGDYQGAAHLLRMGLKRTGSNGFARHATALAPLLARFDSAAAHEVWMVEGGDDPEDLLARARIREVWGDARGARAAFDSLWVTLDAGERWTKTGNGSVRAAYWAIAAAARGDREEALAAGQRSEELAESAGPISAAETRLLLAIYHTRTGQLAQAIQALEKLAPIPSRVSPAFLRLDPTWDPLRDHPRFRILADDPDPTMPARRLDGS